MNREIKFRFWDALDEKMLNDIDIEEFTLHALRDFEGEILQFTGLKDKNGVEIYEGDVVRTPDNTQIMKVVWGYCGWGLQYLDTRSAPGFLNWKSIEVIGNIHENPELLT
jgi:uncharacterized phage protein (TIGR01671 family)